ncbi:MAG: putative FtsW/RodA/SpoVE family cell cycle protein [Acidimicrobiales bacterium]|jgi:cell division protein FtsW (lipid II flippase)|nr:putative FtsW/RodA/SpoVE family cell cycle protein [Acidimicrobiales bacterium]
MMGALRRNTELGLIILAVVLTAGAYALASLGRTASIPANELPFVGVIAGLLAAAHIATRRLAPDADGMLLPLAALLNGLGYVMIARLDHKLAGLQALWTGLGVAAFIVTLIVVRRARDLERYRYTFALIGIGLLLLPLVPVLGQNINGNRIWIRVGGSNFQPGEIAKIVLVIFFASYFVEKRELMSVATRRVGPVMVPDIKYFGPVALAFVVALGVIFFERDLGSALLFFTVFIVMLWVATARTFYLAIGAVMFAAGALFSYATMNHVHQRVVNWLNPWVHANTSGYQVIQSWYALAAGGLSGTGLSLGSPQRIPAVATDFIFSAIGEELGLLGTTAIIAAFLLMVGAGLRIAARADSPFEKLLAAGLSTIIGVQAFIIIGGNIRLVPLTGVTLPFVSYGGSSLISNYILLALLLRISDSRTTAAATPADETRVG